MKALVCAFNQDKALVIAFSVIVKTDGSFAALLMTPRTLPPSLGQWRHLALVSTCALSLVPDVSVTRAQCGHRYWPRNTRVISAIIGIGHCHSLLKINFLIWYKQYCDLWCALQSMEIYLKCIGSIFSRTFKPWKQLQCATNSVYYIEWLWRNLSKFWTDFNQYFVTCQ